MISISNDDYSLESLEFDCCSICMGRFDETLKPHTVPCGHTFCTSCTQKAIEDKNILCADCNANVFSSSYIADFILSKIREMEPEEATRRDQIHDIQPHKLRGLSNRMYELICDQRDELKSLVDASVAAEIDVVSYKLSLHDRNEEHKTLATKINEMTRDNAEILSQLEEEEIRVTKFLMDGETYKKEALNTVMMLDSMTKATNIITASEVVENAHDNLSSWLNGCQADFSCSTTIICSEKVAKKLTVALELYENKEEDEVSLTGEDLRETELSTMEETMSLIEKSETCEKIEETSNYNLLSFEPIIKSLKSGKAFAVQEKDGVTRYAKITAGANKTYLHCLQDIAPPSGVFIIPYDEIIERLNKHAVVSFLDLGWEGENKGRIHILLFPETPIATHFWNLCTGHLGPSYLHTRFLQQYDNPYVVYSSVIAGDYERDDGNGGAPLFEGLQNYSTANLRKIKPGSVGTVEYKRDGPKSGQFQIFTHGFPGKFNGIFGQLQDGLDLVRKAARLDDIKKVRIEDCGIVLPF